jgi:hypothetical protein
MLVRLNTKLNKGDGATKLVAPACNGSPLGSNPDVFQKYKMGDIRKGVSNTLFPAKKYTKSRKFLAFSMHDNILSFLANKYPFVSKHGVFLEFCFFTTDRTIQEDFRGGDRSGSRVAAGRIYKIFVEGTGT